LRDGGRFALRGFIAAILLLSSSFCFASQAKEIPAVACARYLSLEIDYRNPEHIKKLVGIRDLRVSNVVFHGSRFIVQLRAKGRSFYPGVITKSERIEAPPELFSDASTASVKDAIAVLYEKKSGQMDHDFFLHIHFDAVKSTYYFTMYGGDTGGKSQWNLYRVEFKLSEDHSVSAKLDKIRTQETP
jgi:hypothetical protein